LNGRERDIVESVTDLLHLIWAGDATNPIVTFDRSYLKRLHDQLEEALHIDE